jgi:dihydroxyacetone kinase
MIQERWTFNVDGVGAALRLVAETTLLHRKTWDELDAAAGDGDFGSTMSRGFGPLGDQLPPNDGTTGALLFSVGRALIREMGGTSGPLWGGAFLRAGNVAGGRASLTIADLAAMGRAAVGAIEEYGGAAVGDRTILDALVPAVLALELAIAVTEAERASVEDTFRACAEAAADGARGTLDLVPRRGRASYLGDRAIGAPDAGATAVAVFIGALLEGTAEPRCAAELLSGPRHFLDGGGDEDLGREGTAAKQFANNPDDVVQESLAGFASAHADIVRWDLGERVVVRTRATPNVVGLVSGGGSGHEPLHSGFVGAGMLSVAVPGPVFASPSLDAIVAGMRVADVGRGVLQIVKNYTGAVINFRLAAEIARDEGMEVATVLVDDDVAIESDNTVGRRGTGATIFVEKIAGAVADEGADLAAVAEIGQRVVRNSASFGVALSSCTSPGGREFFDLGPEEVEIGVGIHGEAGRRTERHRPATELVSLMVDPLLKALSPQRGANVLALVSGLGATPLMEQYLVFGELETRLAAAGCFVTRSLVGPYITSLNMAGVAISLLLLDDELTRLWDAPVHTAALRWG